MWQDIMEHEPVDCNITLRSCSRSYSDSGEAAAAADDGAVMALSAAASGPPCNIVFGIAACEWF